jgi:cytochrome c oxidase subunit 2
MNGVPGTAMAAFGPQLSDVDLAAVITYQRNAFGNDTGDVIQPTDIKAAR